MLPALWRRPGLLLWLPPAFWAGNLVLGRALAGDFPPVSLAVGRWLVAFVALAPFVAHQAWAERDLLRRHWRLVAACGTFGVAGYNALAYVALEETPAANVALLNSTLPLMVPLAALALDRQPVSVRTMFGIALSSLGAAIILGRGDWRALADWQFGGGDVLVLIAVANYAVYSVLLRRKPVELDPLVFLAATMAAGLATLAPFWAIELARGARVPLDAPSLGAVLYIGLFASLLAFILWNRCVAELGAVVTEISFHLVAVFTALLAFVVLGEAIAAYHLLGIVMILAGFFAATVAAPRHMPARG